MSWKSKYASRKSSGGSGDGLFLKFGDGDAVEVIIPEDSVPHERYRKWTGTAYEDADGPGEGVSARVLLGVYVPARADAKVLEIPSGAFLDLCTALDHPRVGGHEQIYEIRRTGEGKDTRWKVTRLDKASPEEVAASKECNLPDLSKWAKPIAVMAGADKPAPKAAPAKGRKAPEPEPAIDEDVPF